MKPKKKVWSVAGKWRYLEIVQARKNRIIGGIKKKMIEVEVKNTH